MNYYERHIGDYLKNTAHLSLLEHGVYTRLTDVYYTREDGIPVDQAARLIGVRSKDEHAALANVIGEFFVVADGVLRQARCDAEIERYQKKAAHNREVGKLGGRPRKPETQPVQKQEPTNNPGGFQTEPTNNPPQYPVTSNQRNTKTPPPPDGVDATVWQDFLKLRKAKRAPMTDTALDGIRREAEKAGIGLGDALAMCCKRGWQGFEAEWVSGGSSATQQIPGLM